ncbi:hypothetical protein [Thermococcus sp.]|uniref:hypothetical protein n=1 Tax=Thermococcus sp. TaxID=35749 RepID=UPI002620B8D5|nr:hypothetical protein [Thermococcus sp.]
MRVVSVFELRELSLEEALRRLEDVEWVLEEDGSFYPAEFYRDILPATGFTRFHPNSALHPKRPRTNKRRVRP